MNWVGCFYDGSMHTAHVQIISHTYHKDELVISHLLDFVLDLAIA
jgi:hypothetical protein